MYHTLLIFHSAIRWFVLGSLIYAIFTAYKGLTRNEVFTQKANSIRHWTATIAHIQLLIGMAIYVQSPVVLYQTSDSPDKVLNEQTFFRYIHIALMILAIVVITIGSAKAKRMKDDLSKYQTMLRWFTVALVIIFVAIPWPFSPLAGRPYLRNF
jgi:FtsH-binding integral membrane protein